MNHIRSLVILSLICLSLLANRPASAQDLPVPDPDPINGVAIYRQRCANCHGRIGLGDGELVDSLPAAPPPIGSRDYLIGADPIAMATIIQNGNVGAGMPGFGEGNNSNPLSVDEIWDVVAGLYELETLSQPIPSARIVGQVENGSGGDIADAAGAIATIQGFSLAGDEAYNFQTELNPDGRYEFELSQVPPDWSYRVAVNYNGFDFVSDFIRLDPLDPNSTLPVTIFENTTDDSTIRISQLELLVDFSAERVQFAEIYDFSQIETAVYVGAAGDIEKGSIEIAIPEEAENLIVLRGFGQGVADFLPLTAEDYVVESGGLRPKIPVGPGIGSLRLLVRYTLPYERGLTWEKQIDYPIDFIEAVVPDNGVDLTAPAWGEGTLDAGGDPVTSAARLRHTHPPVGEDSVLRLDLDGWPDTVTNAQGLQVLHRDPNREVLISAIALAATIIASMTLIVTWRNSPAPLSERDELLQRIAGLDEGFTAGDLNERAYKTRRKELMQRLQAVWE